MLKTQEQENALQAIIIDRQEEVINRLEAAQNSDRKWKPEVLEAGKFV